MRFSLAGLMLAWLLPAAAQDFIGRYDTNGPDSAGGLYLLPDQRFCLAFSGGALDMLLAGNWTLTTDTKAVQTLVLQQVSPFPSRYAVTVTDRDEVTGDPPPAARRLLLNGAALHMLQADAVLGWSRQPDLPANLAPLFDAASSGGQRVYRLDLPADARYLFLGHPGQDGKLQLERFDTGSKPYVWVNYSINGAQNGQTMTALYTPRHGLSLDGMPLGKPAPLSPADRQAVAANCFAPASNDGNPYLNPVRTDVPLPRLPAAKPWFDGSH